MGRKEIKKKEKKEKKKGEGRRSVGEGGARYRGGVICVSVSLNFAVFLFSLVPSINFGHLPLRHTNCIPILESANDSQSKYLVSADWIAIQGEILTLRIFSKMPKQ